MSRPRRYRARPWRSRFLRAPAAALEFAQRDDFEPLGAVAEVSLGLKTGADAFFFLKASTPQRAEELGRPRSRASVQVRGLSWQGEIAKGDLRGALLNPHRLQGEHGRAFVVPKRTQDLYLSPQKSAPRAGLADYIAVGEREGLPDKPLVRSNASKGRWNRQARAPIDWRWVLPYNSAYDYGAHDNSAHLVLNGRFVGCRAKDGVDEEMLGACLNTTFAIMTRLLEGTATGSEGAYDVGPPAARLTRLPDPRLLTPHREEIRAVLDQWRKENSIPAAPDRTGAVSDLRRRLDEAVLLALGESKGGAASVMERCYTAYGRWRSAVEDVEMRVRQNRRALSAAGRDRSADPVDLVARQVWDELSVDLPLIPSSHLATEVRSDSVAIAPSFRAADSEPMFDAGVVQAANGEGIDLGSYARVRLADRLLRIGFRPPLSIPSDAELAEKIADSYDDALSELNRKAISKARSQIGAEQARDVADAVIRKWHHACHAAGGGDRHAD